MADKRQKVVSVRSEKNELDRIKRLEKENARLRQENDLLKKWQRFLAEEHQSGIDSSQETSSRSEVALRLAGRLPAWMRQ